MKRIRNMKMEVEIPNNLHPDTAHLVCSFAAALASKLYNAQEKYGYGNEWMVEDWRDGCISQMILHMGKGDPRDVAAYCAFAWHHKWKTSIHARITA